MATTVRALLIFLLCTSGSGGDEETVVYLNVDTMKLKDNFGSDTSLFFSGRNLTFDCGCKPDCAKMTVKHGTSTWANDDPAKREITVGLNSSTEFGEYLCSENEEQSNEFVLKYLLCDDDSDMCNHLVCGKEEKDSNKFQFCVRHQDDPNPKTCSALMETICPEETFGSLVLRHRYPCIEGGAVEKSLCRAFAKTKKVRYIAKALADCDNNDYLNVTSSKGERIYLGEIGEFGSEVRVDCGKPKCAKCSENTWQKGQPKRNPFVEKFYLDEPFSLCISQITCETPPDTPKFTTYFFNVRFSAEMNFSHNGDKISCRLLNPPVSDQKRLFRHYVKIFRNGEEWNSTTEETKLVTEASICGNYTCEVWMKFQNCNPFFTTNGTSNSVSPIVIDKKCTNPTSSSESTTIESEGPSSSLSSIGISSPVKVVESKTTQSEGTLSSSSIGIHIPEKVVEQESGDALSTSPSVGIYISVSVVVLLVIGLIVIAVIYFRKKRNAAAKLKTSAKENTTPKEKTSSRKIGSSKSENKCAKKIVIAKTSLPVYLGEKCRRMVEYAEFE